MAAWDRFCDSASGAWFFHTSLWRQYCCAYRVGVEDHSLAAIDAEGNVVGILPIILEPDGSGGWQVSMGGEPCLGPVCADSFWPPLRAEAYRVFAERKVSRVAYRTSPLGTGGGVNLVNGWRDISWRSRIVDLTRSEAELHAGLRKSYRSLVNAGLRDHEWVDSDADPSLVLVYAHAHQRVHNRPRPIETYALMGEWIMKDRIGYVLGARGPQGPWVAFGYFICYKGAAYYASSACEKPGVMHALIWEAMRRLKAKGIARLELGWQGRATDQKGKHVEHFKAGFPGEDYPVYAVERDGSWTAA